MVRGHGYPGAAAADALTPGVAPALGCVSPLGHIVVIQVDPAEDD